MQKVYLLLRSNKQTGPYSLEELLQLNLKPFDLVWVDGRSAAWQYPSEIPSLKPYVPETPHADAPFKPIATAVMEEKLSLASNENYHSQPRIPNFQNTEIPKKVFVSIPKTYASTSEQKAYAGQSAYREHKAYMPPVEEPVYEKKEKVKSTPPSYNQSGSSCLQQKPVEEDAMRTDYSRPLNDVEENYTNRMYKQKTKKKSPVNPKDLVLAVLILAVIGGGYYVMSKPSVANSVLPANKIATQTTRQTTVNNTEETEPKEILSPGQPGQRAIPNTNDISNTTNANISTNANSGSIAAKQPKTIKTKSPVIVSKSQTNSSVPSSQNSMPVEKTNPNIHDGNNNDDDVFNEAEGKQPQENVPVEKKRKLREVIKNIFSKKEEPKNNQVVLENPKPANNRQATRRDADDNSSNSNPGSNEINTASLMEQVVLSSNAPDNWMMGVKNLKITLQNRSNVAIQTASVTVNYYDENNQLLEKKLIYFNNVFPKARTTIAAPDHKFADHVDFKLTTISAKENRYVKY